jgi:hypothetical protein
LKGEHIAYIIASILASLIKSMVRASTCHGVPIAKGAHFLIKEKAHVRLDKLTILLLM